MKWQLALDVLTTKHALDLCEETAEYVDIFEVGTPLVISDGMNAVREIKKHFPDKIILADTKMMDAVGYIAPMIYDAGADIVTVMAAADDMCLINHARVAHEYGKLAEADLMNIANVEQRIQELLDIGIDLFEVHACSEALRPHEFKMNYIKRSLSAGPSDIFTLAHSFTFETVKKVLPFNPGTIVFMIPFLYEQDKSKWNGMAKQTRELFDSAEKQRVSMAKIF